MKISASLRSAALAVAVLSFAFTILFVTRESPAMGPSLRTSLATEAEIDGVYTVIFYGGRHSEDIETVAFLDREDDGYTFEPYAPAFDFEVKKGVPAKEALQLAKRFVSWHPSFRHIELGKVFDDKGKVIGYEVRPLYLATTFGTPDVLDVYYRIKGSTVIVWVKLKPRVESMLRGGGRDSGDKGD